MHIEFIKAHNANYCIAFASQKVIYSNHEKNAFVGWATTVSCYIGYELFLPAF